MIKDRGVSIAVALLLAALAARAQPSGGQGNSGPQFDGTDGVSNPLDAAPRRPDSGRVFPEYIDGSQARDPHRRGAEDNPDLSLEELAEEEDELLRQSDFGAGRIGGRRPRPGEAPPPRRDSPVPGNAPISPVPPSP